MQGHHEQRTVEIIFNPDKLDDEPFSFQPELVELHQDLETRIEFVLKTKGPRAGERARFPRSGFIQVADESPVDLKSEVEANCMRGNLCVPKCDGDSRSFPYQVCAEYGGRVYRSAGWPVLLDPPLIDP